MGGDSISGSTPTGIQQLPPDDGAQSVQATSGGQPQSPTQAGAPPPTSTPTNYGSASVPLLQAPDSSVNPGNLMMLLGDLQNQDENESVTSSKDAIHGNETKFKLAENKRTQEIKKAEKKQKEAKKKGKIMKDLGWAGVALAAVVTVASLGSLGPIATGLMVASLVLATTTEALETDPKTAAWLAKNPAAQWALVGITAGVGLASAGAGIASAVMNTTSAAVDTAVDVGDQAIEMTTKVAQTTENVVKTTEDIVEDAEDIAEKAEDIVDDAEKLKDVTDDGTKVKDMDDGGDQDDDQSSRVANKGQDDNPPDPTDDSSNAPSDPPRASAMARGAQWAARIGQGLQASDQITSGGIGISAGIDERQAGDDEGLANDDEASAKFFESMANNEQQSMQKIVNDMSSIFEIDSKTEKKYGDAMNVVASNITV